MTKPVLAIAGLALICAPGPVVSSAAAQSEQQPQAEGRCPANQSGCTLENAPERIRERVNEGASRVWDDPDARGRVEEVRSTIEDCMECGMDALQDGMDRITGDDSSTPTQDPDSPRGSPQ